MNIQSMSICVPASMCFNNCRYCCSKMHGNDYPNIYNDNEKFHLFVKAMKNALQFARENGCNTIILTGNNEPQQDLNFLKIFSLVNRSLDRPFLNIEIQTSGAFLSVDKIRFLRDTVGVTTVAVSTSCLDDKNANLDIVRSKDKDLILHRIFKDVKAEGLNLRVCLNMNDNIILHDTSVEYLLDFCKNIAKADQVTVRKLWSSDENNAEEKAWINANVTKKTDDLIEKIKEFLHGPESRLLRKLEFGANQYDFHDMSVVIDEDSMAQNADNNAIKYLIFRPDGHLYSRWDSKASRIF